MGFRFRKSVRLLPGVRLNVGTKGLSVSLGGRGTTVNINSRGTRTTLGIPGTGVSYSSYQPHSAGVPRKQLPSHSSRGAGLSVLVALVLGVAAGAAFGMGTGVITAVSAVIILPLLLTIYEARRQRSGPPPVPASSLTSSVSFRGSGFTSAPTSSWVTPTPAGLARSSQSTMAVGPAQTPPTLPPLSPAAMAAITPLLNQRAAYAAEAPGPMRDAQLRDIDAEIRTRLGEIAASPWRYS